MRRFTAFLSAVGATGLLVGSLGACSDSDKGASDQSSASSQSTEGSSAAAGQPAKQPTSVRNGLKALDSAEKEVKGGKAFDLEHDDDGRRVWEVKVASKDDRQYELTVAENGGKVTGKREDTSPDDDVDKLKDTKVTAQQAVRMASKRQAGERLSALDLDRKAKGDVVWQVNTVKSRESQETETMLNAKTGKFLGEKQDD